jgi:hypothetical protein
MTQLQIRRRKHPPLGESEASIPRPYEHADDDDDDDFDVGTSEDNIIDENDIEMSEALQDDPLNHTTPALTRAALTLDC